MAFCCRRRNAELERQLGEQHAEKVRGAAAAAANGDAQALRIRILQEANEAMAGAAAATDRAPVAAATPPLARAIQGAISSLQELPVLKERNRDTAAKPGPPQALLALHLSAQLEHLTAWSECGGAWARQSLQRPLFPISALCVWHLSDFSTWCSKQVGSGWRIPHAEG